MSTKLQKRAKNHLQSGSHRWISWSYTRTALRTHAINETLNVEEMIHIFVYNLCFYAMVHQCYCFFRYIMSIICIFILVRLREWLRMAVYMLERLHTLSAIFTSVTLSRVCCCSYFGIRFHWNLYVLMGLGINLKYVLQILSITASKI